MAKRLPLIAVTATFLIGLSPHFASAQQGQSAPPAVTVVEAEMQNVAPRYEFIGRIEATQSVDLRTRVDGFIEDVLFQDGHDVSRGEVLFKIEPNRYQSAVKAARASLAQAVATQKLAQLQFDRATALLKRGSGSQQTVDQTRADMQGADAQVLAAQAALETAQIDLADTEIKSPIDGRIGRTQITAGNLVNANSGALARVVQLNPIRAVFSVSERAYLDTIQAYVGESAEQVNARYTPRIRLPNGEMYSATGAIEFVDNVIDPTTGTIAIRAVFENPNAFLLPGQFVSVIIDVAQTELRPVLPYQAIQQDRKGRFVLVVGPNNLVSEQRVTIGANTGDGWAITSGLSGGETVIINGFQKAREGQPVNPVPRS